MADKTFYNEILLDHNMHPAHKHDLAEATVAMQGYNPNCGDDLTIKLKLRDGVIESGAFQGTGCAISQASADMMLDLVIGKNKDEALRLADIFIRMIKGQAAPEEIEELEEAGALEDISHMPARVKCAVLGWHTLEQMLAGDR